MKRLTLLFVVFIYIFSNQPAVFAAGASASGDSSVYDTIQHGDKKSSSSVDKATVDQQSSSIFPLFLKFIFSFALVIAILIFILRYISKKGRTMQSNGPILSLGSQMLGNNRSLQIVLIGQTIYILGVGEDVTLLKTISQGEEYMHLLESFEDPGEPVSQKWMNVDTSKLNWKSVFQKHLKSMQKDHGEE
ncbi:flagellar biosynthetic protein FliO [Neobacillus sp. LXY-1]|uniref:flagellar biosynthetic protein FliO n=1 Tax=Neobacillus sp. LXY-1 TaxID=3379133 RepID=UPI003EE207D5